MTILKKIITFISIFLVYSCVTKTTNPNDLTDQNKNIDTSVVHSDTALIGGTTYRAIYKTNNWFYILIQSDTVFKHAELYQDFEFTDFNKDGNKDIVITYLTNVPGIEDVILFNPSDTTFQLVDDLEDFPSSSHLTDNYFYSYHRSGCSDMNWASDLFEIKNFRTIHYGHIYGQGCEYDNESFPKKIDIFKIIDNDEEKQEIFATLPIDTINKYEDDKWGFIADYWSKNYKKFIK